MDEENVLPIRELGIKMLQPELSLIQDLEVKKFTEYSLAMIPEKFFYIPASYSGKYHPCYASGLGGLVKHTKATLMFAEELFNMNIYDFKPITKDYIRCALILHDTAKPDWDHPVRIAKILEALKIDFPIIYRKVMRLISTHMGQWNKPWAKDTKYQGLSLPVPETKAQKFVHLCDYLASRKNIDFPVR